MTDEQAKTATTAALKRCLRRYGIRNVHTSKKAQDAIYRALTMPKPARKEETEAVLGHKHSKETTNARHS